jgi:uncharacterized OB-fold protein
VSPPIPIADADSEPYLAALRRHELVLQQCSVCGRVRFPPMPACPWCGATASEWCAVSGRGRVYSWVGVERALTPEFESEVPYTIATIDLDEGARAFARLDGPEPMVPGGDVTATFVDHEEWTELRFAPIGDVS